MFVFIALVATAMKYSKPSIGVSLLYTTYFMCNYCAKPRNFAAVKAENLEGIVEKLKKIKNELLKVKDILEYWRSVQDVINQDEMLSLELEDRLGSSVHIYYKREPEFGTVLGGLASLVIKLFFAGFILL